MAISRTIAGFDAGWLFLISGLVILACCVLVPAQDALDEARWRQARAQASLEHRIERSERYEAYARALDRGGETITLHLAATQLNMAPASWLAVQHPGDGRANVFDGIEPPPVDLPARHVRETTLRRWTVDPTKRRWVVFGGLVCVLIGLVPPASRSERA